MNVEPKKQPEEMESFFDVRAESYDAQMASSVDNFESFYQAVASPLPRCDDPLRILDIGCGTGLELMAVFNYLPAAQITALDLSGSMLSKLRQKYEKYSHLLTLVQDSYLDFKFDVEAYAVVIAVMTLHHLLPRRKQQLYEQIYQTLEPGGMYIEGDYMVSPQKEKQLLADYHEIMKQNMCPAEGTQHIDIPFSIETQRRLLTSAGFPRVETIYQRGEAAVLLAKRPE